MGAATPLLGAEGPFAILNRGNDVRFVLLGGSAVGANTLEELCDPARMALLVYDMQVGILRQLPNAAEYTPRVIDVLETARAGGYRVLFTRHTSMPLELSGVAQLRTVAHPQQFVRPFRHEDIVRRPEVWALRRDFR